MKDIPKQMPSTSLITSLKSSRSASRKLEPTMAMSSKLSSIGMWRIKVFDMPISSEQRRNLTAKSSVRIDQMNKSSISFSATKETSISKQNLMNGNAFTTSTDRMAHSMEKHLTKRSEKSYNDQIKCPTGNGTLHASPISLLC